MSKVITSLLLLFSTIYITAQGTLGKPCEDYRSLEEVSLEGHSFIRQSNSLFLSRGQSFSLADTVTQIDGIMITIVELYEPDTLRLRLYRGKPPISEEPQNPIASSKIIVNSTIPEDSEVPAYFEFAEPVDINPQDDHYFLVSLNDNQNLIVAVHRDDVYDGGGFIDYTIGGILMTRGWDIAFEVYDCNSSGSTTGDADLDISDNSESIPTLGEWGIIILSLMMLIFSLVVIRQPERLQA